MENTESPLEEMKNELERVISCDAMDVIKTILDRVNKLSDIGKLLLYLKLPTGSLHSLQNVSEKDSASNQTVVNWLKTHLKENKDAYLPKQEVYEKYRSFASQQHFNVVSMTEFGKALRTIFPNVRERRLGKRGDTKYVHSGIQYANAVPVYHVSEIPAVPPSCALQQQQLGGSPGDSVEACAVVLEWAQKLCDQQFTSVTELAEFLIQSQFVSSRSSHAFSVMTAAAVKSNSTVVGLLPAADASDSSVTTNDTHALLRKNLQERKAMVLMKEKMEEERRSVRAQNGTCTTSRYPVCSNGVLSKAVLSKPFVACNTATTQKRILPKSMSDDFDVLQKLSVAKEPAASNAPQAAIRPVSTGSPSTGQFVLLSPSTSQVESPVIVLPSPIVSSRPVNQVVAAPAIVHTSQTPNRTILLLPAADPAARLPQLKPLPGSATIRNLSFTASGASANGSIAAVPHSNYPILPCFPDASVSSIKSTCRVNNSSNIAFQQVHPFGNCPVPVPNYVSGLAISGSWNNVFTTASMTGAVVTTSVSGTKSSSRSISRSLPAHKPPSSSSSSSSSKTVMSLLRENNGNDVVWKAYMKDSRPVASLLREERQKQQMQLSVPVQLAAVSLQSVCPPVALGQTSQASEQVGLWSSFSCGMESLALKSSMISRRPSIERPCSVSELLNLSAFHTTACDTVLPAAVSLSSGTSRKRPHTALDEPQLLTAASDESFRVHSIDRTLNIDLIEKSALDELLNDAGLLSALPKTERLKADDIGVEFDLDIAEPPPTKVSLVNRSAENMTLQQLQQATLSRKSLREHRKQSLADPSNPPLFSGRPVSTLGEPLLSSDGLSVRDSRPNTVAAFWEPSIGRDSSSSVGSCDSQLPDFSVGNAYSHFTPIQNLSEGVPATSDLVRPTAKVPANRLNDSNTETGSAGMSSSEAVLRPDGGKQRRRFRHKSLSRVISQGGPGEQLTEFSDISAASNITCQRNDSPLSAEITDIIGSDQRLHLGFAEFGNLSGETPSPYRSRSVPASVMLDFSLSDALAAEFTGDGSLDVLTGGTEPGNSSQLGSLRNLPVSNELNFWERPARGDHLISGVSFRPPLRNSGTVVRMTSESKETDTVDVVTHTPPSTPNASPNFENVFESSQGQPVAVAIDTPTSLESGSVSDHLVEELFKEVCENGAELLDWDCSS